MATDGTEQQAGHRGLADGTDLASCAREWARPGWARPGGCAWAGGWPGPGIGRAGDGPTPEWARPGNRPGPCMYEMQGPGPVFGRWPAGCPAGGWLIDRLLVPGARVKFRFPGSSCVPGLPPAWCPSPAVTYFYCPEPRWHKGLRGGDLKFFWLSTRYPQRRRCCPPEQALFHQAIHNFLHRQVRFLRWRVGFRHRQVPCPAALTQHGRVDARGGRSRLD